VGAGIALTGVVAAKLQLDHHAPAWLACLGALGTAGVIGLWHGLLVTKGGMPPFVATLGGFLAYRGIGLVLSNTRGLSPMAADFQRLGGRLPPGLSTGICVAAGVVGLAMFMLRQRHRRALGLPTDPLVRTALTLFAVALASTPASALSSATRLTTTST